MWERLQNKYRILINKVVISKTKYRQHLLLCNTILNPSMHTHKNWTMHRFIKIIQWWQISWMHSQKSCLIELLRLFVKYRISSPSSTLKAAASSQSHSQYPSPLTPPLSWRVWAAPAWVQSSGKKHQRCTAPKRKLRFYCFFLAALRCRCRCVCACVCECIDVDFPMRGIGWRGRGGERKVEEGRLPFKRKYNAAEGKWNVYAKRQA